MGRSLEKESRAERENVFLYFLEMAALGRAMGLFLAGREVEGLSRASLFSALSLVAGKISSGKKGAGSRGGERGWKEYGPHYGKEAGDAGTVIEKGRREEGDGGEGKGAALPRPPKIIGSRRAEEKIAELVYREIESFAPGNFEAQGEVLDELQKRSGRKGFAPELLGTTLLLIEEEKRFGGVMGDDFFPADASGGKPGVKAGGGKDIIFASTREMLYRYLDSHPREAEWLAQEMGFARAEEGVPVAFAKGKSMEEVAEDAYNRLRKRNGKRLAKFLFEFGLFRGKERGYACKRHAGMEALGKAVGGFWGKINQSLHPAAGPGLKEGQ